jgi:DNA polymerase theta
VATKYKIPRGLLQSLQQSASTFAAILTNFCDSLQWNLLVLILKQFRERLFFGIHPDLIELMKIPSITSTRMARGLYNNGMHNLTDLANASKLKIEDILLSTNESSKDGKFFISGKSIDVPVQELAKIIICDAQDYLKNELGLRDVRWTETQAKEENLNSQEIQEEKSKVEEVKSAKKRKHTENNNSITETPKSKKINCNDSVEYRKKLRNSNQYQSVVELDSGNNFSLFQNPEITNSPPKNCEANLIGNFINIVDVLKDKKTFERFLIETNRKNNISFSIGVEKIQAKSLTIGGNILGKKMQKSESDDKKKFLFHEKFYIACFCVCCSSNQVYYFDLQNGVKSLIDCAKMFIQKLFARSDVTISMYDARDHLKILQYAEIRKLDNVNAKISDPRLLSWILDPDKNLNWTEMMTKFAPHNLELLRLVASDRATSSLSLNNKSNVDARLRCAVECYLVKELTKEQMTIMNKNSQDKRLLKVLENLEMPIQKSLAKMEFIGFPVDKERLHEMIEFCVTLQRNLENYIFQTNGRRFDISSTKEVAKVLGIHKNREKKKISTAKNVLTKLDIPIAEYIMTYRTLTKTLSNIQPMTKMITKDRIYGSSFSLTQTGRISMHEPNLQNVTKDFHVEYCGEFYTQCLYALLTQNKFLIFSHALFLINLDSNGRRFKELVSFRSVFQCKKGRMLISADFCQLELRILSHLCRDPKLVEIMKCTKEDIFRQIASKWNRVDESKVTEIQRNQTKQLCYGIIYGMGIKSLAEQMKVDEETAAKITEEFHATYPSIRQYNEKIVSKAKQQGYIETVTCRRRYLPALNSTESSERSKGERQALNSTIQGSASDLVKNAILRMEKVIQKKSLDCQLVLHLHDELFYEICESDCKEIVKVLTVSMEKCVELHVPLKVKVKVGSNWGELKEI